MDMRGVCANAGPAVDPESNAATGRNGFQRGGRLGLADSARRESRGVRLLVDCGLGQSVPCRNHHEDQELSRDRPQVCQVLGSMGRKTGTTSI